MSYPISKIKTLDTSCIKTARKIVKDGPADPEDKSSLYAIASLSEMLSVFDKILVPVLELDEKVLEEIISTNMGSLEIEKSKLSRYEEGSSYIKYTNERIEYHEQSTLLAMWALSVKRTSGLKEEA